MTDCTELDDDVEAAVAITGTAVAIEGTPAIVTGVANVATGTGTTPIPWTAGAPCTGLLCNADPGKTLTSDVNPSSTLPPTLSLALKFMVIWGTSMFLFLATLLFRALHTTQQIMIIDETTTNRGPISQ